LSPIVVAVSAIVNKPGLKAAAHHILLSAAGAYCSYTNDPARGPETCQAAVAPKIRCCRIIALLPLDLVHKAGNALQRETARLARLYTNGIFRHG
jgi:hypothetical protein